MKSKSKYYWLLVSMAAFLISSWLFICGLLALSWDSGTSQLLEAEEYRSFFGFIRAFGWFDKLLLFYVIIPIVAFFAPFILLFYGLFELNISYIFIGSLACFPHYMAYIVAKIHKQS